MEFFFSIHALKFSLSNMREKHVFDKERERKIKLSERTIALKFALAPIKQIVHRRIMYGHVYTTFSDMKS